MRAWYNPCTGLPGDRWAAQGSGRTDEGKSWLRPSYVLTFLPSGFAPACGRIGIRKHRQQGEASCRDAPLVADGRCLSDLPFVVRGQQWGRVGGSGGDFEQAGLPPVARGRCDLDFAHLPVASGGLRVRCQRSCRDSSTVRNDGGFRPRADRRSVSAGRRVDGLLRAARSAGTSILGRTRDSLPASNRATACSEAMQSALFAQRHSHLSLGFVAGMKRKSLACPISRK